MEENIRDNSLSEHWCKFISGDKNALGVLLELNFNPLYQYGTRFTEDTELIKDTIQDLFLEIWVKRENASHIISIKAYLFQSVRNNLIQIGRRKSNIQSISHQEEAFSNFSSPELEWISDETNARNELLLTSGIELLPKRQREALYLKYYEDLSHEEIAQIMGLQRQAVANYIHNGLQKLREFWRITISILLAWHFNVEMYN